MGVTRKERLLKAMLSDNAEACRGGVTREERIIASVSKKVCDNDALEGGGGTGGDSGGGSVDWNDIQNKPFGKIDQKYTFTEEDNKNAYNFMCGDSRYYCMIEGEYNAEDMIGSSITHTFGTYNEDTEEDEYVRDTVVLERDMLNIRDSGTDNYANFWINEGAKLFIFPSGGKIYDSDFGFTRNVEKPGIYYRHTYDGDMIHELNLVMNKKLDEAYLPDSVTGGGTGGGGCVYYIDATIIDENNNCQLSRSFEEIASLYANKNLLIAHVNMGTSCIDMPVLTAMEYSFVFGTNANGATFALDINSAGESHFQMFIPE